MVWNGMAWYGMYLNMGATICINTDMYVRENINRYIHDRKWCCFLGLWPEALGLSWRIRGAGPRAQGVRCRICPQGKNGRESLLVAFTLLALSSQQLWVSDDQRAGIEVAVAGFLA